MPQDKYGPLQPAVDKASSIYHAVTNAFGSDGTEDTDAEKKKKMQGPGSGGADPGMVSDANKTFAADPSHRSPAAGGPLDKLEDKYKDAKPMEQMKPLARASFMNKKKAAPPAPAPATSAARNRYGSTSKK